MENSKVLDISDLNIAQDDSCKAYLYFMADKSSRTRLKCADSMDVIGLIRDGLPYATVATILDKTSISRKDLSDILHISVRQMNRYQEDDILSAQQSGFVYELSRLYVRGLDIFGDQETFEKWLRREQPALAMQTPIHLLDTTEGFRLVNDLLSRIEFGFYS